MNKVKDKDIFLLVRNKGDRVALSARRLNKQGIEQKCIRKNIKRGIEQKCIRKKIKQARHRAESLSARDLNKQGIEQKVCQQEV